MKICINTLLTALVFVSLSPAWLYADGLLLDLPPEGTAVKYELRQTGIAHFYEKGMDGEPQKIPMNVEGTMQLANVGSDVVAGLQCRWLEIERDRKRGDERHYSLTKILVPQVDFSRKGDPFARAFRILRTTDREAAPHLVLSAVERQEILTELNEFTTSSPSTLNRVNSELRAQEIELPRGKLNCDGKVFDSAEDRYVPNGPHRIQAYRVFRVFWDPSRPTRTVSMDVHCESQQIGCERMDGLTESTDKLQRLSFSTVTHYRLVEVIDNAQSRFPESN